VSENNPGKIEVSSPIEGGDVDPDSNGTGMLELLGPVDVPLGPAVSAAAVDTEFPTAGSK
jgi:hypothetical protein